jgi:peroxiredoxin
MPALDRASRELAASFGAAAPVVLGIDDPLDSASASAEFARRYHIGYPLLSDSLLAISISRYHVAALPASVLIDRAGLVRSVHLGPLDYPTIMRELPALRQEAPTTRPHVIA